MRTPRPRCAWLLLGLAGCREAAALSQYVGAHEGAPAYAEIEDIMRQAGYFESPPAEAQQDLLAPGVSQQAPARRARSVPEARPSAAGRPALPQRAPPAARRPAAGGPRLWRPPLQEDVDAQIDRAQEAMTLLAQDAAALSAELQVLDGALRAAPATLAQRRPTAPVSMLSLGGGQVPYLPPPDASALAEAAGGAGGGAEALAPPAAGAAEPAAVAEAPAPAGAPVVGEGQAPGAERGGAPGLVESATFQSRFWTLDHKLSDFWTVLVWSLVLLLPAGCCCCLLTRRRPRAQEEHLVR